jgi:hypothetical protein
MQTLMISHFLILVFFVEDVEVVVECKKCVKIRTFFLSFLTSLTFNATCQNISTFFCSIKNASAEIRAAFARINFFKREAFLHDDFFFNLVLKILVRLLNSATLTSPKVICNS